MPRPLLRIGCLLTTVFFLLALLSANGRAGLFGDPVKGMSTVLAEEERPHEDDRPAGKESGTDTFAQLSHAASGLAGEAAAAALPAEAGAWRLLDGIRVPLLRPPLG